MCSCLLHPRHSNHPKKTILEAMEIHYTLWAMPFGTGGGWNYPTLVRDTIGARLICLVLNKPFPATADLGPLNKLFLAGGEGGTVGFHSCSLGCNSLFSSSTHPFPPLVRNKTIKGICVKNSLDQTKKESEKRLSIQV